MDATHILKAAIALFIIMDPFSSLPVFLALTRNIPNRAKAFAANRAALVAGITLLTFTLVGPTFLSIIGVTMQSFTIAGGVLLLLMAISIVMGLDRVQGGEQKMDVAVVLIAVPLITGPGAMTTAIILATKYGTDNVLLAILLSTLGTWLILRAADMVYKVIGKSGNEVLSRISGLLLAAIAVEFIRTGLSI
ncbi:MAG: MarC family protein [Candidatus Burarchaeum sp.]|nr:MarC family protein [Candidatus Burarchaeum sp.]MDO8340271.1 MarC family protein [Candidatus Burarchaeum sp.]